MLKNSISVRIYSLGVLVALSVLCLVVLLFMATQRTSQAFMWVRHTDQVIRTVDEMLGDLREAESGQRGFLLTHSPVYVETFNDRVDSALQEAETLARLTQDNPSQYQKARKLQASTLMRVQSLRIPLSMAQHGKFDDAIAFVAIGRGRTLMEDVSRHAEAMKAAEGSLLHTRTERAEQQSEWNRDLLLLGGPAVLLIIATFMHFLARSVRRPISAVLQSMQAFGDGDFTARAPVHTGTYEFDGLSNAYNEMAGRLTSALDQQQVSDAELLLANEELRARGVALQERGSAIELLGGMAHRMQAARTDSELSEVLHCFLPQVLPEVSGALYVHNNSRNLLTVLASWGDASGIPAGFGPDDCWALRRGQAHVVAHRSHDVICAHVDPSVDSYHCEPILAGGEVIGLLFLKGLVGAQDHFRLTMLAENVALALVNHRLQHGLREQSIRDPLTKLFNRRYLEESLAAEIARSTRSGRPIGVVMCDVDHFKHFNDEFGHDAGDAVLRAVGGLIPAYFRNGDIICRYGGEEFAIIAPDANSETLVAAAERLGAAIQAMALQHNGLSLGPVTMSFGVASAPGTEIVSGEALLRHADSALYQAKHAGRNRVMQAAMPESRLAAE